MGQIKIAKGYGTQFFGHYIPKNAIYGRSGKNIFWYITNFKIQTRKYTNAKYLEMYVLDHTKTNRFVLCKCYEHMTFFNEVLDFLFEHDHFDAKIEYSLNMKYIKYNDCIRKGHKAGSNAFIQRTSKNHGEIPLDFIEAKMARVYVTKNKVKMPDNF